MGLRDHILPQPPSFGEQSVGDVTGCTTADPRSTDSYSQEEGIHP